MMEQVSCDFCDKNIPSDATFCPHCGLSKPEPPEPDIPKTTPQSAPKIIIKKLVPCRVCEKEIATEAATCPHCGISKPGSSEFDAAVSEGWKGIETIFRIAAAILLVLVIAKCNAGN